MFKIVLLITCFIIAFIVIVKIFKYIEKRSLQKVPVLFCYVIFIGLIILNPFRHSIVFTYNYLSKFYYNVDYHSDFYENYEKIDSSKINDEKNFNIVFLYLESFERTFFDTNTFGDIAEKTHKMSKDNLTFTNISQISNTGFTIAGMVASQCGLIFAKKANIMSQDFKHFLPKAVCLTDILDKLGYNSYFSQAGSLSFARTGDFYKEHSIKGLRDTSYFSVKYNNPPQNDWGVYDDILLDDMYSQYIELNEKKEKFMLMGITINTHFPYGYVSPSCPSYLYDKNMDSMSNAIKCSDYEVYNFVNKIKNSQYGNNTIIVIASDHLMMSPNPLTEKLNHLKRRNQFTIINPNRKKPLEVDKAGTTLDVGVTLLDEMGFNIAKLGLGRSLLREDKTIIEKYNGLEQLEIKVNNWIPELLDYWRK